MSLYTLKDTSANGAIEGQITFSTGNMLFDLLFYYLEKYNDSFF